MSRQAKAYVILTATLGVIVLEHAPADIRPSGAVRFLCYLVAAAFTSQLKVRLPGVRGTLSVNFFFLMLGILDLDMRQVLMLACGGALGQMWWHARPRPGPVQMVFNFASITIASYCAFSTYHWRVLQALGGSPPVPLIASTIVFFLANTLAVSGVLALTEGKGFWSIWRENFVWTAARYMALAALAGLVHAVDERTGWEIGLLLLPIVYLIYRSYDLYLGRLEEEKRHVAEMADLHLRTIEALAMAIDAKDDNTHDHLRRVKVYATEIGREMQLSPSDLQALQAAALLHDIGKLAVPESSSRSPAS